jgi:hypothetical protein
VSNLFDGGLWTLGGNELLLFRVVMKIVRVYFLAFVIFCATPTAASERDVQVLQTGNRQVTLAYHLVDFKFDTLQINGETAVRPYFNQALFLGAAGAPALPTRVLVVGIPFGAEAEVTVIPGEIEEWPEINVPPAPGRAQAEAPWRYQSDPQIYERDAYYPAELATVDPPAQFRAQTIARLHVTPVQYNPQRKRLRVYRHVQIIVRFAGGNSSPLRAVESSPAEEEFYRALLVNEEQARAFRQPPAEKLLRQSHPQIEGPLYKFPLRQEGIYKLDGRTLASAGINLQEIKPASIHLYNNGGRELPRALNAPRPNGLVENAIYLAGGGDGRFDQDDYILFYGRGVEGFAFDSTTGVASHYTNHFGFDNYYWLSFGGSNGKRMPERAPQPATGLTPATSFADYLFVEEDLHPLFESDQLWFGWLFTTRGDDRKTYRLRLTDPAPESAANLKFAFYAPPNGTRRQLSVSFEKQELANFELFGNYKTEVYRADKIGGLVNGDNEILLSYQGSGDAAQLYLDYFELRYERQLKLNNGMLIFNGRPGNGPFAYTLNNVEANSLWLFDVSDFSTVTRLTSQNWQTNAAQLTFADIGSSAKAPRRYIAVQPSAFKSVDPKTIVRDEISNWRSPNNGADMVVITHEDFLSLNPLTGKDEGPLARFVSLRQNANVSDTLKAVVVKIQDVFDEFSGGMYDPVAIRDFLKYAYENWRRRPLYVMLVGDGDYDPKNIINKTGKNFIPTFYLGALDEIDSRVTDSRYTYVAGDDEVMDMAIGRIPARSLADVEAYVQKLIRYETAPAFGAWRNTAVMVADDELWQGGIPLPSETVHTNDTELLVRSYTPKYFDVKKIYLTEFAAVQYASISGLTKPSATETLLRLINNGALLINYIGHGRYDLWSHERVLNLPADFSRIQNGDRQALWVAATCTFGKYDIPETQSFAEQLLLAPGRGAIAALATSRDVYADYNARLNQEFYRFLFENKKQISARIGAAMMLARAQTGQTENDEKFHVLGDPSLRLALPRYNANIVSLKPDSITALTVMTAQGKIQRDGADWPEFNGTARIEVFDAQREVKYQSPGQFSIDYTMPGNSLFRGEVPVKNGAFTAQFFVPKDITYGGQTGRLNIYFWNNAIDGNGYRERLPVGGTASGLVDKVGPSINIGFAGVENFRSGGVVGTNPVLRAVISDSLSGINMTGEIGHKITLTIDGRQDAKIDLTDLFNYDAGSYTRGTILHPLNNLREGRHTVEIKAWDNLNNSNTATADFMIQPQDRLILGEVMNYPNPFRRQTTFTFVLNLAAEIRIKIFTLSGRLIRTLEQFNAQAGYNMLEWDGRDEDGDELANGVYLYKIIAIQQQDGAALRAEEIGKLVVQR